jgi:hypothetical protein
VQQNAPAVVQPLLNAFPLPNGPDLGNGTAGFAAGYSDPSTLNTYGIRADYLLAPKITILGRYSDGPSHLESRSSLTFDSNYSNVREIDYRTQTVTLGSNQTLTPNLNNELRFNYSRSRAHGFAMLDTFGGATPPADSVLYPAGTSPQTANFEFLSDLNPYGLRYLTGNVGENVDRQINVTDSLYHIMGAHQMKFGVDYRRISPEIGPEPYGQAYLHTSVSKVLANTVTEAFVVAKQSNVELAFNNWSLFAQDTWKLTRNLTVTMACGGSTIPRRRRPMASFPTPSSASKTWRP